MIYVSLIHNSISDSLCTKENLQKIENERYKYEIAFNRNLASGELKHHLLRVFVYYDQPKLKKKSNDENEKNDVTLSLSDTP